MMLVRVMLSVSERLQLVPVPITVSEVGAVCELLQFSLVPHLGLCPSTKQPLQSR
jgi:hypothetical protein